MELIHEKMLEDCSRHAREMLEGTRQDLGVVLESSLDGERLQIRSTTIRAHHADDPNDT